MFRKFLKQSGESSSLGHWGTGLVQDKRLGLASARSFWQTKWSPRSRCTPKSLQLRWIP